MTPARAGAPVTPARDRYLAAAQGLLDLDLPALAAALCPTGIRGVAPEDVAEAMRGLSTCEMACATAIRRAWGLPGPEPYEAGSAPAVLERLVRGFPELAGGASLDAAEPTALRRPTLAEPPQPGDGLWYAAAPGHPEHVDACVVDLVEGTRALTSDLAAGSLPPTLTYSAVAGGQPPAPGQPGAWAVRLVARTLRWGVVGGRGDGAPGDGVRVPRPARRDVRGWDVSKPGHGRRHRCNNPVLREMGRLARERGADGEAHVVEAARALVGKVPWITAARRGTPEEDRRKIDVVVSTPLGPLCLQVKSSPAAARSWRQTWAHKLIEVVVATPVRETMEARVLDALWRLRHRIEARQEHAA